MAQDVGRWREYVHQSWRNADWTRLRLNLVRPSASVSMRPSVAPARQQTVSEHQQRIGEYRRLRTFDAATGERLARFLEDAARRLERTASLLARARAWLRDEHVLAPADSVLRRAVGAARHNARPPTHEHIVNVLLEGPSSNRCDLARASLGSWRTWTADLGADGSSTHDQQAKKDALGHRPTVPEGGRGARGTGSPDPLEISNPRVYVRLHPMCG